tara:strand:- start:7029 stop:7832 length:804 start_codon:yes stop_codon:yes gene_type:complete
LKDIAKKSQEFRIEILNAIRNAGKGHIGGAYSCIDILTVLYYCGVLNIDKDNYNHSNRNRFLLSKGHAAIAQYVILQDLGLITKEDINLLNNGGILGEHPDHKIPGVEFDSGSLGHGLGVASGFALAAKLDNKSYKTFVVLGDGECHEGTIWEAAMLASHLKLNNLIAIVDRNSLCIHGNTEDINSLSPFCDKWESFGWNVNEIDGHDHDQIFKSLNETDLHKPTVIVANTVKGKGVSFMENDHKWHHGGIDQEVYDNALQQLRSAL